MKVLVLAAVLGAALTAPLAAQDIPPFDDPDERQERLEPPPGLPQSVNRVLRPKPDAPAVERVDTLQDIFRALSACWRPAGLRATGQELTLLFAFKRNGEILGRPKITYYKPGGQEDDRETFTRSIREAFARCSPMPFTDRLGAAVAGRLFTLRFIDAVPL